MIFYRAFMREFANAAIAVFVALFAILITIVLIRLLGQAAGGHVPADAVLSLIGFNAIAELPTVLTLTTFTAVLLTLSRSYRDSEMVVWFAAGKPLTAWIYPVLRLTVPIAILIAGCTLFLSPWAQQKNAEYRTKLESRDDTQRVAPGVFRESSGAKRVFFVESGAGEDGRVRNVFVSDESDKGLSIILSAEGYMQTDEQGNRFVVLEKGRRYDGRPGELEFRQMEFERYLVQLEEKQQADQPSRARTRPTLELISDPTLRNIAELGTRISIPIAALLLSLLAIPLSFVNPRAGRTGNLLQALLTYLIYNNAITIFQAWVYQDRIHFSIAFALPHLIVLVLLAFLFYRRIAITPFWLSRRAS